MHTHTTYVNTVNAIRGCLLGLVYKKLNLSHKVSTATVFDNLSVFITEQDLHNNNNNVHQGVLRAFKVTNCTYSNFFVHFRLLQHVLLWHSLVVVTSAGLART